MDLLKTIEDALKSAFVKVFGKMAIGTNTSVRAITATTKSVSSNLLGLVSVGIYRYRCGGGAGSGGRRGSGGHGSMKPSLMRF